MNVICLEEPAFLALIDRVVTHIKEKHSVKEEKWIDASTAMKLLNISSKSTLQRYRDEGYVRFSQAGRKVILYDRESILKFINANVREIF